MLITKEEFEVFRRPDEIKRKIYIKIKLHIEEALKEIYKIYDGKLDSWYFPDERFIIYNDKIPIVTNKKVDIKREAFYKDDYYSGYLIYSFPTHFLFLSITNIIAKVKSFKHNEEMDEIKRKQNSIKTKELLRLKKDKLIESASKKLTIEEKIALKIK